MKEYTPIPASIINTAKDEDFIGHCGTYEPPCEGCQQSNGDHHYACPVAVQMRSEERLINQMQTHKYTELVEA